MTGNAEQHFLRRYSRKPVQLINFGLESLRAYNLFCFYRKKDLERFLWDMEKYQDLSRINMFSSQSPRSQWKWFPIMNHQKKKPCVYWTKINNFYETRRQMESGWRQPMGNSCHCTRKPQKVNTGSTGEDSGEITWLFFFFFFNAHAHSLYVGGKLF